MVPLSSRERQILAELEASLARDFPDDPAVLFGRDVQGERDVQAHRPTGERAGDGREGTRAEKRAVERPGSRPPPAHPDSRSPAHPAGSGAGAAPGGAPPTPGRLGRLLRSRRTFALLAVVSFVLLGAGMVTGNLWVVVAFVATWSAAFLTGAARLLSWSRKQGY
ncbi:hypothetical protein [Streptomyces sp. AM 2-1-1]|uniref:hypothetical protein n=1 Tax=unclassified Streptomyces TaxID=2593676 RepID=UPI0023BA307E|nr:hypothetical protein [Streptomyces sp. AM 2-1-1]WEH40047.1 hypothetical protein PZB77_11270 [Streptomyces sp. AM 2-1-1]